jgi:hypothetical protein
MTRPWEQQAPRPWETQQPMYPRLVAVTRPNTNDAPGDRGYSGVTKPDETAIASGLAASIQFTGRLSVPLGGTPSDATDRAGWRIIIPASVAPADGTITERDIATDDLQRRYQVFAAWWDVLGFNLQVELLEA